MIKFISSFLAAAVACGSVMSSFVSAEGLSELKDASADSACIEAGFQQYTVDLSGLGALIKRDNVPEDLEHAAYITMTQEDYDELVADPSSYKLCFIASEPVMMRDGIVVSLRNIETADPTVAVPIYAGCKVLAQSERGGHRVAEDALHHGTCTSESGTGYDRRHDGFETQVPYHIGIPRFVGMEQVSDDVPVGQIGRSQVDGEYGEDDYRNGNPDKEQELVEGVLQVS